MLFRQYRTSHITYNPCPHCHQVFHHEWHLTAHILILYGDGNPNMSQVKDAEALSVESLLECLICGKCFLKASYVSAHISKVHHGGPYPHECPKCGKRFCRQGL